jgi:hypothetical protein
MESGSIDDAAAGALPGGTRSGWAVQGLGEGDVHEFPAPVEVRLQGTVEAEVGEPVAVVDRLYPVARPAGRGLRTEEQVHRSVAVGDEAGVA